MWQFALFRTVFFPCGLWLALDVGDGKVARTLHPVPDRPTSAQGVVVSVWYLQHSHATDMLYCALSSCVYGSVCMVVYVCMGPTYSGVVRMYMCCIVSPCNSDNFMNWHFWEAKGICTFAAKIYE